ncbi:MAG: hypothetical protein SGI91_15235 [Alphaproteobacteria bacterium]|nr:hypothetical protein [Alphaproteobacteria bacterium]
MYFEPDPATAKGTAQHLRKLATAQDKLRLIWFSGNFNWRGKDHPASAYPLVVDSLSAPKEFDADSSAPRRSSQKVWWQEEFDAAILDFSPNAKFPVGRRYAQWFAQAEFNGPVVLATAKRRETNPVAGLNRLLLLRKDAPSFADRALRHIRKGARQPIRHCHVSHRGRDPSNLLTGFYAQPNAPRKWSSVYFGTDAEFAKQLSTFFDLPFHDGRPLHEFNDIGSLLTDAGRKRPGRPHHARPYVVWIDCGDRALSDTDVALVFEATKGLAYLPVTIFMAGSTEVDKAEDTLQKMIAVVAPRDELKRWPAFWAGNAIDQLSTSYWHFRDLAQAYGLRLALEKRQDWSPVIEPAAQVLRSTIAPFMMARSAARLVGANDLPSFVRWMKPSLSMHLNREFQRNLKLIVRKLHDADIASELQLRCFTRE